MQNEGGGAAIKVEILHCATLVQNDKKVIIFVILSVFCPPKNLNFIFLEEFMDGDDIAGQSAMLLQDRLLINALKNKDINDDNLQRIYRALRDAVAELNRDFPEVYQKTVTASGGVIPYDLLKGGLSISIKHVKKNGRYVPFITDSSNIYVRGDGQYDVVYALEVFHKGSSGELHVSREVCMPMVIHLTARNYCIMSGRLDEAAVYDSRYNEYAESIRLKRRAHIPARIFA